MKVINQTSKPKTNISNKIVTILIIIAIAIATYVYITTKKPPAKKDISGFGALYSGESKSTNSRALPEKLKWSDSFKGINNMGNK